MTGEAVRRLQKPGEPPYTPVLYALSLFSPEFREAVQKTWPAYMDGKRTLQKAAADLIRALSNSDTARPSFVPFQIVSASALTGPHIRRRTRLLYGVVPPSDSVIRGPRRIGKPLGDYTGRKRRGVWRYAPKMPPAGRS